MKLGILAGCDCCSVAQFQLCLSLCDYCNCISLLTSLLSRPLVTFQLLRQWLLVGTSLSYYFKHDPADRPILPETLPSRGAPTPLSSRLFEHFLQL